MIAYKHITKIIIAVMAVAVVLCFLAIAFSDELAERLGGTSISMEYETKLFDTDEIISIDIQMDEDAWNEMLDNAISEEYYVCDVVINGTKIQNVAIRPKGNTSLSAIAMDDDNDRYSLKLEFDHFVDGQTCYGLDKLILNNNYADATNMKEAIVYDMYQYLDADASLYNYAEVCVNGAYWGVYLALEGVEDSFMLRNFGPQDGKLYKPDTMEMGGGGEGSPGTSMPEMGDMDMSGFDPSEFAGMTPPDGNGGFPGGGQESAPAGDSGFDPGYLPEGDISFDVENMPDIGDLNPSGMGGFSRSGGGADLNYTDDDLDSYSSIWEGAVTGTGDGDHRRVVTALKNISEGTDLETYLDVDNILKYMAVHTFSVNMDSLSGSMAHNYYLYEYGGQLNIFPWDYNLSFGGMGASGDATEMINDAIDTPFSGTMFFDALLENEEYLERYHAYLQQLVDEYVNGGRFDEVYDRIRSQIDGLVETDPTAFYTCDEYQDAAGMLYKTIKLRAKSIAGQLDGSIPSTDAGQRQNSSALVDASNIDIEAMGQFDMGGNGGGGSGGFSGEEGMPENGMSEPPAAGTEGDTDSDQASDQTGPPEMPEGFSPGNMPEGFSPGNMPGGTPPGNQQGGFDPNDMPDGSFGFGPGNAPEGGSFSPPGQGSGSQETQPSFDASENSGGSEVDSVVTDDGRPTFSGMPEQAPGQTKAKNIGTYGICLAVILIALFVLKRYKGKR